MSNIQYFGAVGDGKTDDTEAILHAIEQGDGHVPVSYTHLTLPTNREV